MRTRFRNLVAILFITDILLTQLALYLSAVVRRMVPVGRYIPAGDDFYIPVLHLIVFLIWPVIFVSFDVYNIRRVNRWIVESRTLFPATLAAVFAFAGVLYFSFRDVPRLMIVYFSVLDIGFLFLSRLLIGVILRRGKAKGRYLSRILVVGANEIGAAVAGALKDELGEELVWIGFVDDERDQGEMPVLGTTDDVPEIVQREQVDEIVLALPSSRFCQIESLVHNLQALPVRIRIVPDMFRLAMMSASVEDVSGIPLIGLREPFIQGASWIVKRSFDLSISLAALLLLWPLFVLIAVAVRLDSSGPVLFRQRRIGENGQPFWMYKFRTMHVGAEQEVPCSFVPVGVGKSAPVYKLRCDPRVTRVGRLLRRTSLDELPQLYNVLKGEMSLVGPRPEQAFIVEQYQPWQRQRLVVPPGITGWWQVSGRSDLPMHLNTEYDLFYIRNYSMWLDLKILWWTIGAVIRGKGAY